MPRTPPFFLLLLLVAAPLAGNATGPSIESLAAVATNDGRIHIRFNLAGAFDHPDIVRAVQSGVPTGFTYRVRLVRKRPNWFDSRLDEATIEVLCTFDSVRQEYLLNYRRNRKLVRAETVRDLASVRQRMTMIDEAELFQTSRSASKLRVLVQADVIRGFVFYIVPRDVTTRWEEVRVNRDQGR